MLVKGVEGEDKPLNTSVFTKCVWEQPALGRQRAGSAGNDTGDHGGIGRSQVSKALEHERYIPGKAAPELVHPGRSWQPGSTHTENEEQEDFLPKSNQPQWRLSV